MSVAGDILMRLYSKYRRRFPTIIAVKKRTCHVLAIASTYRTLKSDCFFASGFFRTTRRIRQIHRMWVERLWVLSANDLWLLQRGLVATPDMIEPNRLCRSFKRLATCVCKNVVYNRFRLQFQKKRACNKSNVCPHCWANNLAAQNYVVRRVINKELRKHVDLPLSCSLFVFERRIDALVGGPTFAAAVDRQRDILYLQNVFNDLQPVKCNLQKRASAKTQQQLVGLIWRFVLIPQAVSWRLQLRILCVHRLPPNKIKNVICGRRPNLLSLVTQSTVLFDDATPWRQRKTDPAGPDAENYKQLVLFGQYPIEMLTEDVDTVSVAINATTGVRMIGGYRAFRRIATAVVRERAEEQKKIQNKKVRRNANAE